MIVLPLCSLPNVAWLAHLLTGDEVVIDIGEHFVKQSHRNRFEILHHQGRQVLSFPVKGRKGTHIPVRDILLDDEMQWKKLHWRSIVSAYASSPYFLYYEKGLAKLFEKEHFGLSSLNIELLEWLLGALQIAVPERSETYVESTEGMRDLRNKFKGKGHSWSMEFPSYLQVFDDRLPFEENLSGIDLLFNLGPEAAAYLRERAVELKTS